MSEALLSRVVLERQPDGRWELVRDRGETADRFICDDLNEAFDTVLAAYRPDGTPRSWPIPEAG